MMKKTIFINLLIILLVIIISLFIFIAHREQNKVILFYSKQCPHCQIVKKFLRDSNIRQKLIFDGKEVSENRRNLRQLIRIEKKCGIPVKDYIEVPLLWTGTDCIAGDQKIIDFFRNRLQEMQP